MAEEDVGGCERCGFEEGLEFGGDGLDCGFVGRGLGKAHAGPVVENCTDGGGKSADHGWVLGGGTRCASDDDHNGIGRRRTRWAVDSEVEGVSADVHKGRCAARAGIPVDSGHDDDDDDYVAVSLGECGTSGIRQ